VFRILRRAHPARHVAGVAACALLLLGSGAGGLAGVAGAEQASEPAAAPAGGLDIGSYHSCAVLSTRDVRCWGYGINGQLGYGNTATIGDDETPAAVGPLSLGGRSVSAIAAGDAHNCAVLDDGSVRCWGFGGDGRLGYDNTASIGDNEVPVSAGPVELGGPAKAISAGAAHTCAVLVDGSVLCWGFGGTGANGGVTADGRLGYGNNRTIGDTETPASVGPVPLGGLKAAAISAGGSHTCALIDDGSVRCWGRNRSGQLGYGTTTNVGDAATTTPDKLGPVKLGGPAVAISAGDAHTCALLADASVRCWGSGAGGQLGYGSTANVGDTPATTPDKVGPVPLGGLKAVAISAGGAHTCALVADASVRCWGSGAGGQLGYGSTANVGDTPATTPATVGHVDLGPGRGAVAISAGLEHTCARLDDGHVRCWGSGTTGRLGYCNANSVGDDETPGSAGPVSLEAGDGGTGCPRVPLGLTPGSAPSPPAAVAAGPPAPSSPGPSSLDDTAAARAAQNLRARALRHCLGGVAFRARRQRARTRQISPPSRAIARRRIARRARRDRRRCLKLDGRTPGRVSALHARATGAHTITLSFNAAGTDHANPPPARSYLIKQSLRPIRSQRDFAVARALCDGSCTFNVLRIGATVTLKITDLDPGRTYYYAIAARDNVSRRPGPRSETISGYLRDVGS